MATKETILDKIDTELAELEENTPFAKRDQEYFNSLQVKTSLRNALYNTPMSDRIAGLLAEKDDILQDIREYQGQLDLKTLSIEPDDYYEITYMYLEHLDYNDRDSQLYERAKAEYAGLMENLKRKAPQQIIEAAYEIVMKADILCLLESHDMDKKDVNILLTLEKPLDSIYQEWMKSDCSYMDMLRQAMDDLIDVQEHHLTFHQFDHEGKSPDIMQDYYDEYEGMDNKLAQEEDEEVAEP